MRSFASLREDNLRSWPLGEPIVGKSRSGRPLNSRLEGELPCWTPEYDWQWPESTASPVWPSIDRTARGPTGRPREQTSIDLNHLGLVQPLSEGLSILQADQSVVRNFKPSTVYTPNARLSASTVGTPQLEVITWPPQRRKLARYATDLKTNWIQFQPQIISFDPPPAIARFTPPPSYYKRVARPMTEILTLVDHARMDPQNALAYQEEAWRKSEEAKERFRNGIESWHLERALTSDLRPSAVSHMLEIAPDALQAGALFYRILTNSGYPSDSARRVCLPGQMLDRGISATANLQGWLPPLEAGLGILGAGADYAHRLKVARAYTDDGLRAWSIATGDFFAERATALALGVLGSYVLAAIPGVGPFLALGLSLFSGALARRLTVRMPTTA